MIELALGAVLFGGILVLCAIYEVVASTWRR
jgi:hypothetical protein